MITTIVLAAAAALPTTLETSVAYDHRCQYCGTGTTARGRDIDSNLVGASSRWSEGPLAASVGVRLEFTEGYQNFSSSTPPTTEHAVSFMVHYDPGPYAFALGFQHQRESILIWDANLGLPAVALRAGYSRGLHAYLSFGDFGTWAESAATLQMGIGLELPAGIRLHGGLAAELAPAVAYEVGLEVGVAAGFGLAIRGALSAPETTEFRYLGGGLTWRGDIDTSFELLQPRGRPPE